MDSASNNVFVYLQKLLTTHETLEAKKAFEDYCASEGVVPQTYLSDNGAAFTSQQYTEELSKFSQISKFAGVGAHHHNAKAERAIRTIMSIARTMMLHAAIHWPDTADPALWPMAVKHAEYLFNRIPDPSTGLSPRDIFTRTRWPLKKLHDVHVFGCPAYVLDKTIQDGKKLPRWKPCSDRRIYVGVSHSHASTVGLCLNLTTGAITPQYHVVYDDEFATVSSTPEDLSMLTAPEWIKLFGDSAYQYVQDFDEADPPLDPTLDPVLAHRDKVSAALDRHRQPPELPRYQPPGPVTTGQQPPPMLDPATSASTPSQPQSKHQKTKHPRYKPTPPHPTPTPRPVTPPVGEMSALRETMALREHQQREKTPNVTSPASLDPSNSSNRGSLVTDLEVARHPVRQTHSSPGSQVTDVEYPASPRTPTTTDVTSPGDDQHHLRRSNRVRTAPTLTTASSLGNMQSVGSYSNASQEAQHAHDRAYGTYKSLAESPLAFVAASNKDPDTLSWDQCMKDPHREEWIAAALKEIRALEEKGTWKEVDISEAQTKILPGSLWGSFIH